ncbi:MAG: MBL fold metallo-hydrolase [Bacteroidales bacterium]|jgi:L-ascorbate metabolism protein UlaG (beta-lactamase superfamily)|nr:MBL fold metallo-hydrolase [Bacteroidales bacterium]
MKRKIFIGLFGFAYLIAGCSTVYTCLPKFGSTPKGERLRKIQRSSNYREGRFQNLNPTPQMTDNLWNALFQPASKRQKPKDLIPVVQTNLAALNPQDDLLVWFGHSSYYLQAAGKRFLVDPVFSRAASPVSFVNTAFRGSDYFRADDIPNIDYLIITHDHWDHLDYPTVMKLKPRTGRVICPLGVGTHFERWDFDVSAIVEMDWQDSVSLMQNTEIHCLPARHFSGRGFKQRQSLWASFLLKFDNLTIYIGGDSGYDTHFAEIGARFGPIDFAVLENGQYNKAWKYIHAQPEETLQTATDLNAKNLIPVHNSKFAMSRHSWDEPLQRLSESADNQTPVRVLTPQIGEIVFLKDTLQTFSRWWQNLE